jgi:hypothetical protein
MEGIMEELWVIESDGKRRRGKLCVCEQCNKEFVVRKNSKIKLCSIECKGLFRQKRVSVKCSCCEKEFEKHPSKLANSKSGLYFCSRACKDNSQKTDGVCEIVPPHYGSSKGRQASKRYLYGLDKPCCEGCGEQKRYLLSVHHKDGNHKNTAVENFEIVCFNCHVKRHLKLVNGQWVYFTKSLTPRELLKDL